METEKTGVQVEAGGETQAKAADKTKVVSENRLKIKIKESIYVVILSVALALGATLAHQHYFKKVYIVDYTAIINKVKNEIESDVMRGDQYSATLRVKLLQEIAKETENFCKEKAENKKIEVFASNVVFAPVSRTVDLTPELLQRLADKKLIVDSNTTK